MNSECDENCCISLKAKEPITSGPRIKPFKNDLSSVVHHCLKGHRVKEGRAGSDKEAYPAFPQPPPHPALLAYLTLLPRSHP